MNWQPRDQLLALYASDPRLWQHRVVLMRACNNQWVVMSPDRDVFVMDLSGANVLGLIRYKKEVPASLSAERVYLARDSEKGDFGPDEIDKAIESCSDVGERRRRQEGVPAGTEGAYRAVKSSLALGINRGDTLTEHGKHFVAGDYLLKAVGGGAVLGEYVADADFDGWVKQSTEEVENVRIMPILYDNSSGERYRSMDEIAAMAHTVAFDDWPVDGPRSVAWFLRQLRRSHLTFVTHHNLWVQKSGVREGDRVVHEHASLCRSLNLLCSYDQVAVSNLAGAEALVKRLMLLEEAYRGRPSAPNFDGAEFFLGITDPQDGSFVDPEVRKHAATKRREEADILKEQRKWGEEMRARAEASKGPKGAGRGGDKPGGG